MVPLPGTPGHSVILTSSPVSCLLSPVSCLLTPPTNFFSIPYYRGKSPREIFYSSSDSGELTQGVEDSAAFGKEKDFFGGEGNNSNCRLPVL